jgi:type II pantothenate kinase
VNIPHFLYFTDSQFSEADLARSLLFTISNDVGQVASLYAMMHKLNKVIQFLERHLMSLWAYDLELILF